MKQQKFTFLICMILFSNFSTASELSGALSGVYKHDEQPVWVQITNQDNVVSGTFLRHELKPEFSGQSFIKEFTADTDNPFLWNGLVYAARLKEFIAAEINQDSTDAFVLTATVKVGFVKRTVVSKWTRSEVAPNEQ